MTLRTALWLVGAPWLVLGTLACEPIKLDECKTDQECNTYEYCDTKLGACVLRTCSTNDNCGLEGRCDVPNAYCVAAPCDPACPSYEGCAHGTCVGRYLGITFVEPTDGGTVGSPATVRALLEVDPRFARQDPASLELSITPGPSPITLLPQTGGTYSGTWSPIVDQMYGLIAAYPAAGIQSAGINVHADLTPPMLAITVPPPSRRPDDAGWAQDYDDQMPNAWRRDESATVQVSANEALDPASVQVKLFGIEDAGTPGPLGVTVSLTTSCGTNCYEGAVDLGQPMMRVGRGTMEVVATANDQVGNASATDGGIEVTRVRWIFNASSTDGIKTAPAIGPTGRVYFGTASGTGTAGALWAVDATGEQKWTAPVGAVEASPAVGRGTDGSIETVYAAFNTSGATVLAAFDSMGSEMYRSADAGTGRAYLSLGVGPTQYSEPTPVESAFILLNDGASNGKLVAIRPGGNANDQLMFVDNTGLGEYPSGIAVLGSTVYFPDNYDSIHAYSLDGSGWSIPAGWPFTVGITAKSVMPTFSDVFGTAGVPVPAMGGAFSIPTTGGSTFSWTYPTSFPGSSPAWCAARSSNGLVFATGGTAGSASLVRAAPSTSPTTVPTSFVSKSAPLVGSDGMVYIVGTTNGRVAAFRSDLSPDWTLDLSGAISASPNMDCRRDPSGTPQSGLATLYVATESGRLYSIVADSNGIDTTAPWPRYQHDPRNTGNADTPLSEFACP